MQFCDGAEMAPDTHADDSRIVTRAGLTVAIPILALLLVLAPPVITYPQTPPSSGFVHESWTARDGLPINSIPHLRQSKSCSLWLATFDGLVRFDGVTVFNTANLPGLPTNGVVRINPVSKV